MLKKSSLFSRFPNDPIIRRSFFKFRKLYSRSCKCKFKEFKSSLIAQLDSMFERDPESYWKLLKDLKEDSNVNDPCQSISASEWLTHFSTLYEIKGKVSGKNLQFQKNLESISHLKTFSELDS